MEAIESKWKREANGQSSNNTLSVLININVKKKFIKTVIGDVVAHLKRQNIHCFVPPQKLEGLSY